MANINLLSSPSRIETPYIKVQIGAYVFGVFDKTSINLTNGQVINNIKYPNYIQGLKIEKINGTVNKYTLNMRYPITEFVDPNFFEKVFSSVSQSRKIIFSYGDLSAPSYVYKDEEAIILDVKKNFEMSSSVITYTVKAVSVGTLLSVGAYSFTSSEWTGRHKPSALIKKVLFDKRYGLQEVFYGMSDKNLVETEGLIAADDVYTNIRAKTNISPIDYVLYLVDCMKSSTTRKQASFYTLVVVDDTSGKFKGPYFKVVKTDKIKEMPSAYDLDVGFPSSNIVTNFQVDNDESYSIYFNFQEKLNDVQTVQRLDDEGNLIEQYAPILTSNTSNRLTNEEEKTWWSKVTEYPIKAKITVKGLLRPAILMTHVRLNIYCYGRKFLDSGLYAVTKQEDEINTSGYRTTLSLLRVGKATDIDEL